MKINYFQFLKLKLFLGETHANGRFRKEIGKFCPTTIVKKGTFRKNLKGRNK